MKSRDARLSEIQAELTRVSEENIRLSHRLETALSEAARAHNRIDGLPKTVSGVDEGLRKRFYILVGKLREWKLTSQAWGHSHEIRIFEGDL